MSLRCEFCYVFTLVYCLPWVFPERARRWAGGLLGSCWWQRCKEAVALNTDQDPVKGEGVTSRRNHPGSAGLDGGASHSAGRGRGANLTWRRRGNWQHPLPKERSELRCAAETPPLINRGVLLTIQSFQCFRNALTAGSLPSQSCLPGRSPSLLTPGLPASPQPLPAGASLLSPPLPVHTSWVIRMETPRQPPQQTRVMCDRPGAKRNRLYSFKD